MVKPKLSDKPECNCVCHKRLMMDESRVDRSSKCKHCNPLKVKDTEKCTCVGSMAVTMRGEKPYCAECHKEKVIPLEQPQTDVLPKPKHRKLLGQDFIDNCNKIQQSEQEKCPHNCNCWEKEYDKKWNKEHHNTKRKSFIRSEIEKSYEKGYQDARDRYRFRENELIKKAKEEVINILENTAISCSGSCGAGCEIAVQNLIKNLIKKLK